MTTSSSVWISFLVNIMSTHQQEEWNVVERSACNCSHFTWKSASHAIATKMSQTTSWVPMRSLPLAQHKKWTLVALMGCVHTHQKIHAIEGCGSPSCFWNIMEKDGENIWKVGKDGWAVSQMFAPRLEHDKIWTQWVSHILLESMLKRVWWCKCSKMEFGNQTICCPMSYSKEGRHAHGRGDRKSQATSKCCWKKTNQNISNHVSLFGKLSTKRGAWAWFHDIWTCGATVQNF